MPSCLGGNKAGCEKGPEALRNALFPLLDAKRLRFRDFGDMTKPCKCTIQASPAKCLKEITETYDQAKEFLKANNVFAPSNFPVLLGGDHSMNYPFIRKSARHRKIGLIWFDAHGDFNTPEISPSGNIHGMVLAALGGKGLTEKFGDIQPIIAPHNICIIGSRALDPKEEELIQQANINLFSMQEIKKRGLSAVLEDARKAAARGTEGIHLSFDMDVFDPTIAPDVSTPVADGLFKKSIQTIVHAFKKQPIVSMDIMEVSPSKQSESSKAASLGAELVVNLFK